MTERKGPAARGYVVIISAGKNEGCVLWKHGSSEPESGDSSGRRGGIGPDEMPWRAVGWRDGGRWLRMGTGLDRLLAVVALRAMDAPPQDNEGLRKMAALRAMQCPFLDAITY